MCPACKQPMIALELDGIEIDHCPACLGTWLDAGEIEAIAERAGVEVGPLAEALEKARKGDKADRRCPRCRRRMRIIHPAEPSGLELDRCPLGHGLWFDRGEMKLLVGAVSADEQGGVAAFFADLYRSELDSNAKGE